MESPTSHHSAATTRMGHSRSSSMLSYDRISEVLSDDDEIVWSVAGSIISTSTNSTKDGFVLVSPDSIFEQQRQPSNSGTGANDMGSLADSLQRLAVQSSDSGNQYPRAASTPTSTVSVKLPEPKLKSSPAPWPLPPKPKSKSKSNGSGNGKSSPAPSASTPPVSPKRSKNRRSQQQHQATGQRPVKATSKCKGTEVPIKTGSKPPTVTTPALVPHSQSQTSSAPATATTITPLPDMRFGARSVVDDFSDTESILTTNAYEDAVNYMTSFLTNPTSSYSRLEVLQSLIIELGLVISSEALPTSVKAARSLLKSRVFINVRDYLAVRQQGQEALQSVMHPSRRALVTSLRSCKRSNRVPVTHVKNNGLSVFLVACYN